MAEEIDADVIRDQEILRGISRWRNDPQGTNFRRKTLLEMLYWDKGFCHIFEHFAALTLTGQDIRDLASALFCQILRQEGVNAHRNSVPGFVSLWRLAIRQPIDEQDHINWVRDEIFKALPKSLRFANDIYSFWHCNSQVDIDRSGHRADLRKQVTARARDIFEGKAREFLRVIDPDSIFISFHFCIHFSMPKNGGVGFDATEWLWFARLLLDAGEVDPQIIIPQIAGLLSQESSSITDHGYDIDSKRARELFGIISTDSHTSC